MRASLKLFNCILLIVVILQFLLFGVSVYHLASGQLSPVEVSFHVTCAVANVLFIFFNVKTLYL
jgi:hypothetical protein